MSRRPRFGWTSTVSAHLISCGLMVCGAWAESIPKDDRLPTDPPRFACGSRVMWVDGSCGRVVERPQWRSEDAKGQWYYPVQFGGADSLRWLLPEEGLSLLVSDDDGDPPGSP